MDFPGDASDKEPACQCRRPKRCWFDPWVGKIPWRSEWQPTPVFLPGESHGQKPGGLQFIGSQRVRHDWSDVALEWSDQGDGEMLEVGEYQVEGTTNAKTLCVCAKLLQWHLMLCDAMDCSLLDSYVHGILQARIMEWVAMPSSRGFSQPKDQTQISCIAGKFFTIWATEEALGGCLLHWQVGSWPLSHLGSPSKTSEWPESAGEETL